MKEFLIKIRSLLEGNGFDSAQQSLSDLKGESADTGNAMGGLSEASSSAADSTRDLGTEQASTNSSMAEATATIAKVTAAAAALKGAYDLVTGAVAAYAEKQQAVAGLDASLAARGQLTDDYREKLQALAGQLQSTTAVGDEAWYGVFQKLTQFGADTSNIEHYTEAVKNLAGFLGGDVQSAASLFGRAMEGNFQMLSRYGIKVDESGTQTEKLNQLMEQLATRGGGVMEARARTISGSLDQVNNVIGDLMASMGQMINQNGGLNTFLQDWISGMERINASMGKTIPQVDGLRNAVVLQGMSAQDAARLNAEYADALKAAETASTDAETALNKSIATAERSARSTAEMARAERDLALARIDADDSLSASDKLTKRAEIEEAYRASTLAGEQDLAQKTIALREASATEAEARAAAVRAKAAEAAEAAAAANAKSAATVRGAEEIAAAERVAQQIEAQRKAQEGKVATMTRGFLNPEVYDAEVRALERLNVGLERQKALVESMGAPDAEAVAQAEAAQMAAEALAAQADEAERAAKAVRERADAENEVAKELVEQKETLAAISDETARTKEQSAIAGAEAKEAAEAQRTAAQEIAQANRDAAAAKKEEEAAAKSIANLEKRGGKRITGTGGNVLRDADGNLTEGASESGMGTVSDRIGSRLNRPPGAPAPDADPVPQTPSPEAPRRSTARQQQQPTPGPASDGRAEQTIDQINEETKNHNAAVVAALERLLTTTKGLAAIPAQIEGISTEMENLKRRVDNLRV